VFALFNVKVPAADLVSAKLPVNVPAKVSEPLLFTVNTAAVPLSVTTPLPVTLATCCAKPFKSNVPESESAVPVGRALAIPSAIVPALIVVAPEYVLAPLNVKLPTSDFVSAKLPVIVPANVSAPELLIVKIAAAPLSVTTPLPVTLATCCAKPFKSNVPESESVVPVGNALATPSCIVPALILVAPL